jgi:hypothetical protein
LQKRHLYGLIVLLGVGFLAAIFVPRFWGPEGDIFVPIHFDNVPTGLIVFSPSANGLELRIRGSQSDRDALLNTPPTYHMDLTGIAAGVETLPIRPESLSLPWRVAIIRVHPDAITLKVERKANKTLPVTATVVGSPQAGYQITHLDTEPKQIPVSGPAKILEPLTSAPTKPIEVSNTTESFKKEVGLDLPESIDVIGEAKFVTAEVTIEEKVIVTTLYNLPVRWHHTPYEVTITPPVITIDVKGTEKNLAKLTQENHIDVFVDLEGLSPGVYVRRAAVDLPVGTALAGASPELFTVTIKGK